MNNKSLVESGQRRLSLVGGLLLLWGLVGGGALVIVLGQIFIGAIVLGLGIVLGLLLISGRLGLGNHFTTANLLFIVISIVLFVLIMVFQTFLIPPDLRTIWYGYLGVLVVLGGIATYYAAKIPKEPSSTSQRS